MRRRIPVLIVSAASITVMLASSGFGGGSRTQPDPARLRKYTLEVEGPAGVHLDMLLIIKPTADSGPTRESARVELPFSKRFDASRCFVWFDATPVAAGGERGEKCRIVLKTEGQIVSQAETTTESGSGETSGLGDL